MVTDLLVKQAMTVNPVIVEPDKTVLEAVKKMRDKEVGSLLVCEDSELLGIITESDIMREVAANDKKASKFKVKDIMSTDLISTTPEDSLSDATRTMVKENVRRLPVKRNGKLLGLLTEKDVLKVSPSLSDVIVERMHVRERQRKPLESRATFEGQCESCDQFSEDLKRAGGELLCPECRERVS